MEDFSSLNPFDQLGAWIFSQPREVQEEIAYSVLNFIPGCEDSFPDMDVEALPGKLRAWLDKQVEHSLVARISTILFVRAVIDYFVMRRKGSKENWQENKLLNQQISAELRLEGHSTELIDTVVRSVPFRQRLWSRSFQDWDEFRNGRISDADLDYWFDTELRA